MPGSTDRPDKPDKRGRLAARVTAAALVLGGGFAVVVGATGMFGTHGPSSAIPAPPRANAAFVEDEDGTGADNQANIMNVTAPGLVRMTNASGATAGLGEVITPSGIVITSDSILGKARRVTVRLVLSDRAYTAHLIGAKADIALLQIQGGGTFRPVTVGNSRGFAVGLAETTLGNDGAPKTITLNVGNISAMNATAIVSGRRLTGLMATSSQVVTGQQNGGPLVNLSGQVVGIEVGRAGSGLHTSGFAVPIDRALSIARRITRQ